MLAVDRKEPGNLFSPRDSGTVVCENILVGHEPCNYRCCAARYLDGALTELFSILSALIGSPLFVVAFLKILSNYSFVSLFEPDIFAKLKKKTSIFIRRKSFINKLRSSTFYKRSAAARNRSGILKRATVAG